MNRTTRTAVAWYSGFLVGFCLAVTPASAQNTTVYSDPVLLKQSDAVFSNPSDLTTSPEGAYLLVADTGNNEIKIMQPGSLKILSQFGKSELEAPESLRFGPKGNLVVIDRNQSRQVSYNFKGVFRDGSPNVKKLGEEKADPAQMKQPGTATDSNGQSYRADTINNQIEIFDESDTRISIYGATVLKAPRAIETVGRYFWVADTGNNRILLLKAPRPEGQ